MARRGDHDKADTPAPRTRRGGGALGFVLSLLVLAALVGGAALGGVYYVNREFTRPGPAVAETVVELPRGAGLITIANRLEAAGVITDARIFRLAVTVDGGERALKAGEYRLEAGASMFAIYQQLRAGDVVEHLVTFAEGLTSAMIVRQLAAEEVLSGQTPPVPPEGTLLPETFQVVRGTSRAELLERMARDQDALIDALWDTRAPDLPFDTPEEAIILASIVEKETGIGGERAKVAGVFINRLTRNPPMRLETDPTIIYGISQGEPLRHADGRRRTLFRSEIDDASNPYNTYQIDGLPPGPICNPGREAIAAVLNPAETDALFFVADGSGGHAFARTYAEHQSNVRRWRVVERERIAAQRGE